MFGFTKNKRSAVVNSHFLLFKDSDGEEFVVDTCSVSYVKRYGDFSRIHFEQDDFLEVNLPVSVIHTLLENHVGLWKDRDHQRARQTA